MLQGCLEPYRELASRLTSEAYPHKESFPSPRRLSIGPWRQFFSHRPLTGRTWVSMDCYVTVLVRHSCRTELHRAGRSHINPILQVYIWYDQLSSIGKSFLSLQRSNRLWRPEEEKPSAPRKLTQTNHNFGGLARQIIWLRKVTSAKTALCIDIFLVGSRTKVGVLLASPTSSVNAHNHTISHLCLLSLLCSLLFHGIRHVGQCVELPVVHRIIAVSHDCARPVNP